MIKGIGIDLTEIDRIKLSLKKSNNLVKRVLTKREQIVYEQLNSEKRKIEYIAGRFAAKEAFAKATGFGIGELSFQDIEILNLPTGAPTISARGYENDNLFVSISHTDKYVTAQVIIESKS